MRRTVANMRLLKLLAADKRQTSSSGECAHGSIQSIEPKSGQCSREWCDSESRTLADLITRRWCDSEPQKLADLISRSMFFSGDGQRGAILLGLLITIIVLAVLMGTMMSMTITATYNELFASRQERAYYLAEAGGRYGIRQIRADIDPSGIYTVDSGNQFVLTTSEPGDGNIYLDSQGVINSGTSGAWLEAKAKITYRIQESSTSSIDELLGYGVFADDSIFMTNVVLVTGDAGTNGDITAHNQADVNGAEDTYLGLEIPPPPAPPAITSPNEEITRLTDLGRAISGRYPDPVYTLQAGTYQWDGQLKLYHQATLNIEDGVILSVTDPHGINLSLNSAINISGEVTIVTTSLTLNNYSNINVLPGGRLTVFGSDRFFINDQTSVNYLEDSTPGQFTFYGLHDCENVDVVNSADIRGLIYAPDAKIKFTNDATSEGSIIGDTIDLYNSAAITFGPTTPLDGASGSDTPIIQYFSVQ